MRIGVERIANPQPAGPRSDLLDHAVIELALHKDARSQCAALAAGHETRMGNGVDRLIYIGIVERRCAETCRHIRTTRA